MTARLVPAYPTPEHEQAAQAVRDHFAAPGAVSAVLLMGSTARGKASRDSCLDFLILVEPEALARRRATLEQEWTTFYESSAVFRDLRQVGRFSHVDLTFVDGQFTPHPRSWTSGPDEFELEIGNTLAYSVALWQQDGYLAQIKARWLPYYNEDLRRQRLEMVRRYCLNNLDHIPLFVERGLFFQAFHRLYDAFGEFLQALFIARRVYPIAYDKWIREQVEEILGLPDLYVQLPRILEIRQLESREIVDKGEQVRALLDAYIT